MPTIILNLNDKITEVSSQFLLDNVNTFRSNVPGPQGLQGLQGLKGEVGQGIDHVKATGTTDPEGDFSTQGETDTYTIYGDDSETIILGWFDVKNGESAYEYAVAGGYTGTKVEFNTSLSTISNAESESQLSQWVAEASELTTNSFTSAPIDTEVSIFTSNGDGTFTEAVQTGVYSSLHYNVKSLEALDSMLSLGTSTSVADIIERDTLVNLTVSDTVFVTNNGDGKWARYIVTSTVDGTGANSTWAVIMDEDVYLNANSAAEIKTAYESNADTNAFTDAEKTKLASAEISSQLDARDTANRSRANHTGTQSVDTLTETVSIKLMTSDERTKLIGIEDNATADQTASEIETLYEGIANTNKYTDSEKSKVSNVPTDTITELVGKQDTLVNQVNIKSINGVSILGLGDMNVSAGSSGYAANVYLTQLVSTTVGTYEQLSYSPEPTEAILNGITNNNEVLLADYIFDGDVRTTIIPAGEWGFHFHRKVDNTAGDSKIRFEVFARSSIGVETILFSTASKSIEDTVFDRESILITQPQFNLETTDRVGVKVYVNTTRTSNVTVSMKVGDGEAAYLVTPLEVRHNQLRARDDVDSHPIEAITGLALALADKVDSSRVLTDVPAGAVFTDTVYTHPLYSGSDISTSTGPLVGATVVSDLDFNITTDTYGHVTDATSAISTRTMTLADLGYTGSLDANTYVLPSTVIHEFELSSSTTSTSITTAANSAAVKAAYDNVPVHDHTAITGNAATATKLKTVRTINLTGDVAGSAVFDGTADASIAVTIQPSSVVLGIDTSGDYVSDISAGTGISVTGTPSNGWIPTVSLGTIGIAGTYRSVTTDAYGRVTAGTNPTTVSEYGLTDVYTKTQVDTGIGTLTEFNSTINF